MIRLGISPRLTDFENKAPFVNQWLDQVGTRFDVQSGSSNPVASEVPEGQWMIYTNTSLGETRIWANIGGTLVKSAAFT